MEKDRTTEDARPPSPVLVAPREAAVVDGTEVTFEWQAVEAADRYRLQVAQDAEFDTIVLERDVAGATEMTVTDAFPTDGQTFFWRVLAESDTGWSHGEHVESFVSGTAEDAEQQVASPDREEGLGPATELVKAASEQVAAEVKGGDQDRLEREKEMGVAYEGIPTGQIMSIAFTLLLIIGIAVVILFVWTSTTAQAVREATVSPDQYTQLRETEAQAAQKLTQYEVIDEQNGVYRIPIDRAMDLMATQAYQDENRSYSPEAPLQNQR